jgi:hypothetical protein
MYNYLDYINLEMKLTETDTLGHCWLLNTKALSLLQKRPHF